jgi:F-type H+-transporting ATPase subunit a
MEKPAIAAAKPAPTIDPSHHGSDSPAFELFESMHPDTFLHGIKLPKIGDFQITKFHILLAVAAAIVAASLIWLGRKMKSGDTPRGILWNMLESLLFFVRDNIARPGIGEHDGDKYVPFLTTTFFFILTCNLLGMIPFLGSPTASIAVTAALALISFVVTHATGIKEHGLGGYFNAAFVPHISLEGMPPALKFIMSVTLIPMIFVLEVMTPFIRLFVLAVRLFANLLAGHAALYVMLVFIQMVSKPNWLAYNEASPNLYYLVAPLSTLLVTVMSLLELLVAGLQAFIFTLLTAIFIGLAKHPAH